MAETTSAPTPKQSDEEIIAEELEYWESLDPQNDLERELIAFKIRQLKKGIVPLNKEEWDAYLDAMEG